MRNGNEGNGTSERNDRDDAPKASKSGRETQQQGAGRGEGDGDGVLDGWKGFEAERCKGRSGKITPSQGSRRCVLWSWVLGAEGGMGEGMEVWFGGDR